MPIRRRDGLEASPGRSHLIFSLRLSLITPAQRRHDMGLMRPEQRQSRSHVTAVTVPRGHQAQHGAPSHPRSFSAMPRRPEPPATMEPTRRRTTRRTSQARRRPPPPRGDTPDTSPVDNAEATKLRRTERARQMNAVRDRGRGLTPGRFRTLRAQRPTASAASIEVAFVVSTAVECWFGAIARSRPATRRRGSGRWPSRRSSPTLGVLAVQQREVDVTDPAAAREILELLSREAAEEQRRRSTLSNAVRHMEPQVA